MSASLLTHEHSTGNRQAVPPQLPPSLPHYAPKPARTHDLDSLLGETRSAGATTSTEREVLEDPRPGIFLGLRVALLFNAGVSVVALLAYEGWALLAR